jgi:thiol-disulfide isomerase/thioredoxin
MMFVGKKERGRSAASHGRGGVIAVMAFALVSLVACGQSSEQSTEGAGEAALIFEPPVEEMTLQFVRDPVQVNDVTIQDLDGGILSLSELRGKVILVNYWATWCGPCRYEIPQLMKLQERYGEHLQVFGVSTDAGDPANVEAFAREFNINYPIVMSTPEINRQFPGVFALPTSFVIDTEGRVVQTHVGLINPAVLEQEIRYLAALPTNVTVELIENTQQTRLANAAQATEIPGLDLSHLSPEKKEAALQRLNEDGCVCGCELTLAQCRINDAACGVSLPLAEQVVSEIAGAN